MLQIMSYSFPSPHSSLHHYSANWSFSLWSIGRSSRAAHAFSSCRVFLMWLSCKGVFLHHQKNSYITVVLWSSGLFDDPELTSVSFLLYQSVDLATHNVFAVSLMGLFWFMACTTDSDTSLDFILSVNKRYQMQMPDLKSTLGLFMLPFSLFRH